MILVCEQLSAWIIQSSSSSESSYFRIRFTTRISEDAEVSKQEIERMIIVGGGTALGIPTFSLKAPSLIYLCRPFLPQPQEGVRLEQYLGCHRDPLAA